MFYSVGEQFPCGVLLVNFQKENKMSNLECNFNETDVDILLNDKPTVYQVFDGKGVYVYVGKTEAGRARK